MWDGKSLTVTFVNDHRKKKNLVLCDLGKQTVNYFFLKGYFMQSDWKRKLKASVSMKLVSGGRERGCQGG